MSEEFDPAFYVAWYGQEVEVDAGGARQHWERYGRANGWQPTFDSLLAQHGLRTAELPTNFDWAEYIGLNPDLPRDWDRWRATFHWLTQGATEKRNHSIPPLLRGKKNDAQLIVALDEEWYSHTYGVADGGARQHYLDVGRLNFLAPNPHFSPLDYLEQYSDVALAEIDPVVHYVANGHGEGRLFRPADPDKERRRHIHMPPALDKAREFFAFDVDFYRSIRPDLASLDDADLRLHYQVHGENEGKRPSRYFDPNYYRSRYAAELERWSGCALDHFLHIGLMQNFFPSPEVLSGARRAQIASPVAWMGHWLSEPGFSPLSKTRPVDHPLSWRAAVTPKSEAAERRVLNWIIPKFSKGGGGHYNIFRCARTLSRLGWQSAFWIEDQITDSELDDLAAEFIGHYPVSPGSFKRMSDGFSEVEGEFLIATAWTTAYKGLLNQKRNARIYLVQDRESLFSPAGAEALQAEWSFHLGYDYICAGQWLEQLVEGTGGSLQTFELCPEPSSSAHDPRVVDRHVLAVIYIRTHTARRCSEMMIEVANRLAREALGEVVVIGDASASGVDPAVVNVGTLPMDEMTALFQRARFGLVASATNYSILPIEMAAAGMVVVQPFSSSTQVTTGRQGAHSTEPTVESLVDFILEGSRDLDQTKFDELRGTYRTFALSLSWESEFEKIASWLETKIEPKNAVGLLKRPTATVVIPTYYPDEGFHEIVEAVRCQLSSFDVTLQIVDSRRDGECSQVIREIEGDGYANVHAIDAAEFEHGRTRNLAAGLSQSDFYAYLTQDAKPANEYWLESLLSPFLTVPHCAYTVGRHRAYDGHHPLYGVNLDRHFDSIADHGVITSRREHAEKFSADPWFAANLSFNSDNNAGYRGDLLRRHGFPQVPFGEDQALSYKFLRLGYYRVYTPSSVVIHSHDYTQDPAEAFRRGAEEADSVFQNFGLIRFENLRAVLDAKFAAEQDAYSDAARLGLRADGVALYLHSVHQSIEGAWMASRRILRKGTTG